MAAPYGYREVEHTADWALEVWAPDLPTLFAQAALGMYALSGTRLQEGTPHFRTLTVTGADAEILLVNFLSELLYLAEDENLGAERCEFSFANGSLRARLSLLPIAGQEKEIKAVTFHNLAIRQGTRGLEVMIVFDV